MTTAFALPPPLGPPGDRRCRIAPADPHRRWRHWRAPLPSVGEARRFAAWLRRSLRETGVLLPCGAEDAAWLVELALALDAPKRGRRVELEEQHRRRNPPPTVHVYRSNAPRAAPPKTRGLSLAELDAIEDAARSVGTDFRRNSEQRRDLRQNLALKLLECTAAPPNPKAWCIRVAKNLVIDEKRKPETRHVPYQEEPEPHEDEHTFRATFNPFRGGEDAIIAAIDLSRGVVHLTAPTDRALFWDLLRARCSAWLECVWTGVETGELSPHDLTELRVDGKPLTPTEATWLRLLSMSKCPEDLELTSETSTKDVFDRYYEAVKKAFQRAALKGIDMHVPQKGSCETSSH
ncbi:MAG TPA: hypothetical protein VE987_15910 [Polyangiaceae bacterium]|nr:hypothetical protein [Polyangiaceae bacterium]